MDTKDDNGACLASVNVSRETGAFCVLTMGTMTKSLA